MYAYTYIYIYIWDLLLLVDQLAAHHLELHVGLTTIIIINSKSN